jgi:hypothetical protein
MPSWCRPCPERDATCYDVPHFTPGVLAARERSAVWGQVRKRYAVEALGPESYVVRGDTIGGSDQLYLDALARGSEPQTGDRLARRLFAELPPALQKLVMRELRNAET